MPSAARERRRLAVADGVGAADDHAARGLAEDVREPGDRDRAARPTSSANGLPAPTGRELVGVADEHDVRPRRRPRAAA